MIIGLFYNSFRVIIIKRNAEELKDITLTIRQYINFSALLIIRLSLKSFYASVECIERNLDSMTTNLIVADASRTKKTICLAVSQSLKFFGIPGRARLFEVV